MYTDDYGGLFAMLGIMIVFIALVCIIAYVINALAFRKVLRVMGHQNPNVAWIPIYSQICIAEATQAYGVVLFGKYIPMSTFRLFPLIPLASGLINAIPILGAIASFVLTIGYLICCYHFYKLVYGVIDGNTDLSGFDVVSFLTIFIPLIALFKFFLASEGKVSFAGIQSYNAAFGGQAANNTQSYGGTNPYYDNQGYMNQQGFNGQSMNNGYPMQGGQPVQGFGGNQGMNGNQGFQPYQQQGFNNQQMNQGFGHPEPPQDSQGFQPQQQVPQQQSSDDDDFTFI